MEDITEEELRREITEILKNASLANTSTKKVIQKLEKKLGLDLSEKKKLIDQLVMDYVNELDSESDEAEEEEEVVVNKKKKKPADDEEEEERDDSNDSDWGGNCDHELVREENHSCPVRQQVPTISTSQLRRSLPQLRSQQPQPQGQAQAQAQALPQVKKAIILKRVAKAPEDDEAEIFGKLTAKKLRKLPEKDRDCLMIEINQLIYKKCHPPAKPRNETKGPVVVNPKSKVPAQFKAKMIYRVDSLPKHIKPPVKPEAQPLPPKPVTPEPSYCNIM